MKQIRKRKAEPNRGMQRYYFNQLIVAVVAFFSCNPISDNAHQDSSLGSFKHYFLIENDTCMFKLLLPESDYEILRTNQNFTNELREKIWVKSDSCQITYTVCSNMGMGNLSHIEYMKEYMNNDLDVHSFNKPSDSNSRCVISWAKDSTWVNAECYDELNDFRLFLTVVDGWFLECTVARRPELGKDGFWNEMFVNIPIVVQMR